MTYIETTSKALTDVLRHACNAQPDRFKGYAANVDFWVGEVRHSLDVMKGYDARFKKMEAIDPTIQRTTDYSERSLAKRVLLEQAKRFLIRCEKLELYPREYIGDLAIQLGIPTPLQEG